MDDTQPPEAVPKPSLDPVRTDERIASVDVLRGFALLGILVMNIYAFSMPMSAYENPRNYGGATGVDLGTWVLTTLLFNQKFMAIFSMLFGAGLVLMDRRAEARGATFRGVYYRRILWLLLIGLVHAYVIWWGDVLYSYAVCGLLLYRFRARTAKALIRAGLLVLLVAPLVGIGTGFFFRYMRDTAADAEAVVEAGDVPTEAQEKWRKEWDELQTYFSPTPEEITEEIEIYRDGYLGIIKHRAPHVFMMQTMLMLFFLLWRIGGLMLVGMGLMKLGVFSAQRTPGFYTRCMVVGYGLGLPIVGSGTYAALTHDFEIVYLFLFASHFNYFGSVLVAMGHIGLVMRLHQVGAFVGPRDRLAAVGRMALTNYLMHSVILTLVFYGYGGGLFGHFGRFAQMGFVVAVWVLQLWLSPIWLRHFRFGPVEWLWRSLAYRHAQPMRLSSNAT